MAMKNQKRGTTPGFDFIEEYVTRAQFTDGGAAIGTYQMKSAIPVGGHVLATTYTQITGFTGDTSAVMTVGDGTDADRYNTGTPSVLTTTARLDLGIASGTRFIATANRPTITITGGADWGSIEAGGFDIRVYGWMV